MAAWKRKGGLEPFREKIVAGMLARGYEKGFAEQIYQQIKGFGDYGFPESHSASFALLAYVSAWLKCHYPAQFLCALLNSQPMGFYAPAQLVQDARRHGVTVLPVDVLFSEHDCTLEPGALQARSVRLGLRMVSGLSTTGSEMILQARVQQVFTDVADMVRRTGLNQRDRDSLAAADALKSLAGDRHRAFWDARGVEQLPPLFDAVRNSAGPPSDTRAGTVALMLPRPTEAQDIMADYNQTGLTLRRHPLCLWRDHLDNYLVSTAQHLQQLPDRQAIKVAGLVTCRQRPQTAAGVTFLTLEDETGFMNIVIWPALLKDYYRIVHEAGFMGVSGYLQQSDGVTHIVAVKLVDLSHWLANMRLQSRDFS